MTTPTAAILTDLLHAALNDCNVMLPPKVERQLLDRMIELGELAAIELAPAEEPKPRIPRIY